jgi:hypothetical protein
MRVTASRSPSETPADATSIRSTLRDPRSASAMLTFSEVENETWRVCSPSRRVVSSSST